LLYEEVIEVSAKKGFSRLTENIEIVLNSIGEGEELMLIFFFRLLGMKLLKIQSYISMILILK